MMKKLDITDIVFTWIVPGAMTVLYFTRVISGWFAAVLLIFLILLMVIFTFRIFIIFITRD